MSTLLRRPVARPVDPLAITDRDKLEELLAALNQGESRRIDEAELATTLKTRVRGQDHVVDEIARLLRLQFARERRSRPVASLLFLGPTGTGKTELARALAAALFGDEKGMLRFDCSEFSGPEAKTRLIGTPLGYQGAETGGQLTRPILNNPRRLILFDEIEKAYVGVFDLFLQMLGDGARLTEQGSGRAADFSQSVVIMTSNAEYDAIGRIEEQVNDPHMRADAIKKHLRDSKVFRPEILGRIDRVCVFRPLGAAVQAEITVLKMRLLAQEYGLELTYVDAEMIVDALIKSQKLKDFGTRELERVVGDQLGDGFLAARDSGAKRVRARMTDTGIVIEPAL